MSSPSTFITIDEVVANSATLIPEQHIDPRLRNLMRQWTYLGERQLGFSGLHEKVSNWINVVELTIQKPKDLAVPIDLSLFDDSDAEYRYRYMGRNGRIHSGVAYPFIGDRNIGLTEDPYNFYLDSSGEGVTKALIKYYSYPLDESGNMLIPEHHLLALMMFNYWMYTKRYAEDDGRSKSDWIMEMTKAKAKNKMPSGLETKDIVMHHSSMIDRLFLNNF